MDKPQGFTVAKIREAMEIFKANDIPLHTVQSAEEAAEITREDPLGKQWSVGDQYFEMPIKQNG